MSSLEFIHPRIETPKPTVNTGDEAAANLEALNMLGVYTYPNSEQLERELAELTAAFDDLVQNQNRTGELVVRAQLFSQEVSIRSLCKRVDSKHYDDPRYIGRKSNAPRSYTESYVYDALWTPGTTPNSYTPTDLNGFTNSDGASIEDYSAMARLILTDSTESPNESSLFALSLPLDGKHAEPGEVTQLQYVADQQQEYGQDNHDFELLSEITCESIIRAAIHRIKGVPMPVGWGYKRFPELGRRDVDGDSYVGNFYSLVGRLKLGRSRGRRDDDIGVGLSVGRK